MENPPPSHPNSPSLPPPPTQTLDHYSESHDHARARMTFEENAQPKSPHEEGEIESSSPLVVGGSVNDHEDEIEEWISCNRTEPEVDKPLVSIASGSLSWYDDEKPSMVGVGLANLGNTCFLNAVLQCFTHTVLLIQKLHSYTQVMPCDCDGERFCLFCALWEHINLSLSLSGKIVSPVKFVDNLSYFSSWFRRFQQEDAHEFLQCFLDRLESSSSHLKAKDVAFSSQNDNLVKQVFGGRVVSKLRCCSCNHCSDTYEPSVDLSLEIEDANNLSTALESFTKVEHIEDEEMKFTCEKCNQKVSVEKQLMLDQTPLVCALHLKRFKNDGSYVEKIDKHVEFPLELDLQPYTCSSHASNVGLKYELYAVIVHTAFTSTCGHYYCYIRSAPNTWYKFDDSKVTKVSEEYVLSEEAYILFYAKHDTPWFSNFMETYKLPLDPNFSNTSPKSVLDNVDHACTSPYASNSHSHDISEMSKAEDSICQESFDRSIENTTVPLRLRNSFGVNSSVLNEYSSNDRFEVQKNADVSITPTRHHKLEVTDLKDVQSRVLTTPDLRPNYSSGGRSMFDIDKVFSPSTPPRSPGIDISGDENSEVVFAPKPDQLKLAEKASSKRPRTKEFDDVAKREALRRCKKMPGARGILFMAAIDASSSKSKRSNKTALSPRKNHNSRSRDRFKHHSSLVSRNLATSSFR